MKTKIISVESIQERDIDLLLLEELTVDDHFCEWFINELGLPEMTSTNGAWKSISEFGIGETDILYSYNSGSIKIYVLIEDKLDAFFQENQAIRYDQRALNYVSKLECDESYFVLVAPQKYCENQFEFKRFLTYESIANKLMVTGGKRGVFKSELLKIAIEKLRRGYSPINSEIVSLFMNAYWNYVTINHPTFKMNQPKVVPFGSDWPALTDYRIKGVTFYHKLGRGNTDASFFGFSDDFMSKVREKQPSFAKLENHGKTFSLRIFSGEIDRTRNFEEQIELVENGLRNLERLRDWIIENEIVDFN